MNWLCATHRLAQFWADARMPAIVTNNGGVLIDDTDHQQIDRPIAEPAAGSFSNPADGLSWNRPGPDVDRPVLVRRPAGTLRPLTAVALDRTPHFDAAGRFIHPCFNCGREAILRHPRQRSRRAARLLVLRRVQTAVITLQVKGAGG
jgi:hypothetical protein